MELTDNGLSVHKLGWPMSDAGLVIKIAVADQYSLGITKVEMVEVILLPSQIKSPKLTFTLFVNHLISTSNLRVRIILI